MKCYACEAECERSCTHCGKFFCDRHGGMRLPEHLAPHPMQYSPRALCDACAPDQEALRRAQERTRFAGALIYFPVCLAVGALIVFVLVPDLLKALGR